MRNVVLRALRVLAQFVVAGGRTRAIDAWVVDRDPAWQLTVLALTQLVIAFAQAYLEDQGVIPTVFNPTPRHPDSSAPSRRKAVAQRLASAGQ
jgi:hypothetical protein